MDVLGVGGQPKIDFRSRNLNYREHISKHPLLKLLAGEYYFSLNYGGNGSEGTSHDSYLVLEAIIGFFSGF